MGTANDILVANLEDALQQGQRYVAYGALSAVLIVLLTIDVPELISLKQKVEIPTVGKVGPGTAYVMLLIGYLVFGVLANSADARVTKIIPKISDSKLTEAALTRLSLFTIESRVVRVSAALLPPVLILVGYVIERTRVDQSPSSGITSNQLLGFLVIASPYLLLAARLLKTLSVPTKSDT